MGRVSTTRYVRCEICNTGFFTNHSNARTCSNKCRQEAYRRRKEQREEAKRQQLPLC